MKIITRRLGQIVQNLPSALVTLTNELQDIGIDIETKETPLTISVIEDIDGKKKIVIEKS